MPEDLRSDHDDSLLFGVVEELKQKLNNDIQYNYFYYPKIIVIGMRRSSCAVDVLLDQTTMIIQMDKLPDGSYIEEEKYNLFDPGFDPIKQICRFVDKSSKHIKSYERRVKESRDFLNEVL